ncbi:MAG TPA: hypothetical protein VL988_11615 [Solirubrobacteraceae bacterium]|nr:hypothetical protein [Solirubrobacteraceae bacterium]
MTGRGAISVGLLGACAALVASGCGGGSEQNHGEAKRTYEMQISAAKFPTKQAVARPAQLTLQVHNESSHTVPNVAITVDSFSYVEKYPELAANKRPVWVVEEGPGTPAKLPVQSQSVSPPGGGQTAYVNTWALGPLKAGASRTFTWKVVPVKSGSYTVHLRVGAGLAGNAKAVLAGGGEGPVTRSLTATIAPKPPITHVDPNTGKVVPGPFPAQPKSS